MRGRRFFAGGLALLLAACQALPTGSGAQERITKASTSGSANVLRKTAPKEQEAAQVKPTPGASPSVSPSPSAKPTLPPWGVGPMKSLSGKTLIDASYALKMGGSLISNNSGGLISNNGGGVIAIGSGLISNNAGGLISNNSGGLISNNSGGLISEKGLGYRLLAEEAVAQGLLLPVKGLMVTPVSLATGVQIGPTVLTDETGSYTLQVPEAQTGNIRVVASVPGKDEADPVAKDERLQYNLIVPVAPQTAQAESVQLDEDSALMAKFLRMSFLNHLDELFSADDQAALDEIFKNWYMTDAIKQMVLPQVSELAKAAREAGYKSQTAERKAALCQVVLDTLMAHVDLSAMRMEKAQTKFKAKFSGPLMPSMTGGLKWIRTKADQVLAQDSHGFDQNVYLLETNAQRPPEKAYKILKGADFGEYLVREYLSKTADEGDEKVRDVLASIGADRNEKDENVAILMMTAAVGIVQEMAETLLLDKGGAKTEALAWIKRFRDQYGPAAPAASPSPSP